MRWVVHLVVVLVAWPVPGAAQPVVPASDLLAERYSIGVGANPAIVLDAVMDGAFAFGRAWVLERSRLLAFDDDGELVAEIGRSGAGPGEFTLAARLRADSILRVSDVQLSRTSLFRSDGELITTEVLPRSEYGGSGIQVPLRGGHMIVATTARFSAQAESHDPRIHVVLVGTGAPDTLVSIRSGGGLWQREGAYGGFNSGLGDAGGWDVSGDTMVAVADGQSGAVSWHCAPTYAVCDQVDLGVTSSPLSSSDVQAMRDSASRASRRELRRDEVIDYPARVPVASAAIFASDGEWLWIQSDGSYDGGRAFSVLRRGRGVVARVSFDSPTRILAVSDGGILVCRRGEFGETVVTRLEWRRWPSF